MSTQTSATLLEKIRDGNTPVAWDDFFERYWQLVFTWSRRRGCSEHTAEEVVQDVMLALFSQRDVFSFDPAKGRFRDWLFGIVRNIVAKRKRSPQQRDRSRGVADDTHDPMHDLVDEKTLHPDDAWQDAFERSTLGVLLDLVRHEVPPRVWQAFELTTMHGLSGAEASKLTGQSRNAVYLARRRIAKRLKQLGAKFRNQTELSESVKTLIDELPDATVHRQLAQRTMQTMLSRHDALTLGHNDEERS